MSRGVERPATKTVTITEDQRNILLNGLANELVDVQRYMSGPKPSEEPGPMDDCCEGHRLRWQDSVDRYAALDAKKQAIKDTIAVLLYPGEKF
jgi:hypothetical protein